MADDDDDEIMNYNDKYESNKSIPSTTPSEQCSLLKIKENGKCCFLHYQKLKDYFDIDKKII